MLAQIDIYKDLTTRYDNGVFSGSFIFFGKESTGKKRTAQEICAHILGIKAIDLLRHPDFFIIEEEHSVEKIKAMVEFLSDKPLISSRRIAIVDDAHRMNINSQNAFLKTFEEVHSDAIIIMITHKLNSLLDTIKSRAEHIYFPRLKSQKIYEILRETYDEKYSKYGSRYGLGKLSYSYSVLGDEEFKLTVFRVKSIMDYILEGNNRGILQRISLIKDGYEEILIEYFLVWLRDILYLKDNSSIENLVYQDYIDSLKRQASVLSLEWINKAVRTFEQASEFIEQNIDRRAVILQSVLLLKRELNIEQLKKEGVL